MKDFGDIFATWESRGGQVPQGKPDVTPVVLPARATMENRNADDELDLHGLLKEAAVLLVRNFLTRARNDGARKVIVIHGKGLHSGEGKAVLKDAVRQVLVKNPNVAAWGEAKREQGGSGATWVWLK